MKAKKSQNAGTTRVGGKNTMAEETKERVRKPKWDFANEARCSTGAKITIDEDGKMTDVPVNWDNAYALLSTKDFTTKVVFYQWKQATIDARMQILQDKRDLLDERIEEAIRGPDPVKSKQKKLARLKKQLAELEKQLQDDGIAV